MTDKAAVPDGEGPGTRADRARKRRLIIYVVVYAVVAAAFIVAMSWVRHEPGPADHPFSPEAAIVVTALFPLLFGGAMVIAWRLLDEVSHRIVTTAWAAGYIAIAFGTCCWMFLSMGGLTPAPNAIALLMGSMVIMMFVAWLKGRI
jgi:hypothetical protein